MVQAQPPAAGRRSARSARSGSSRVSAREAACRGGSAPSCANRPGSRALAEITDVSPPFCGIRWDSARSSLRPTAPWSSRRRRPATPSRSPPCCRRPAVPAARSWRTPRLLPLLQPPMGRKEKQLPLASSGFHCIPVLSTIKIASILSRSGTVPVGDDTQRMRWRGGWQQRLDPLPKTNPASANHHPQTI